MKSHRLNLYQRLSLLGVTFLVMLAASLAQGMVEDSKKNDKCAKKLIEGLFKSKIGSAAPNSSKDKKRSPDSKEAAPESESIKLGIGILATDVNGQKYLAVGPYAGTNHGEIFRLLGDSIIPSHILWLGEIHYMNIGDSIMILSANETSGSYARNELEDLLNEAGNPIIVQNEVGEIPNSVRAQNYQAFAFDPNKKRLVPELNELKDVRHELANIIMVILSVWDILEMRTVSAEVKFKSYHNLKERNGLSTIK
jgi:hypothetical protein